MPKARRLGRLHLVGAAVWALLAIPTVLWWKDSVLWVAFCSLYANAGYHVTAYGASRAERASEND
jgi:hypothetical protein